MKKRYLAVAAGMALSMSLAAGCAAKTEEPATETVTEAVQEEASEAEITEEEAAGEEVSGEEGSEEEAAAEMTSDLVCIWGTVTSTEDGLMNVENESDVSSPGEMIFTIDPETTKILDAESGLPVELEDVEEGAFEAYIGPAMTMSLPPQTTPEIVLVNIPEDFQAPKYVVADRDMEKIDTGRLLMGEDGSVYLLPNDVEISPYLTRNIVTLDDITEGSKVLIWEEQDGLAERVVLFAE